MPNAPFDDNFDDAACQRALSIVMRVGIAIVEELETPSETVNVAARARAYAVASLGVRRTILLARHIAHERDAAQAQRGQARKEIIRSVEDTIRRVARPEEATGLRVELLERVDTLDFEQDLLHRPREKVAADLCRDLGLSNDPDRRPLIRRTPDDIAILSAQAAAPPNAGLARWHRSEQPIPDRKPPRPNRH